MRSTLIVECKRACHSWEIWCGVVLVAMATALWYRCVEYPPTGALHCTALLVRRVPQVVCLVDHGRVSQRSVVATGTSLLHVAWLHVAWLSDHCEMYFDFQELLARWIAL